jgi:hypothetical protein
MGDWSSFGTCSGYPTGGFWKPSYRRGESGFGKASEPDCGWREVWNVLNVFMTNCLNRSKSSIIGGAWRNSVLLGNRKRSIGGGVYRRNLSFGQLQGRLLAEILIVLDGSIVVSKLGSRRAARKQVVQGGAARPTGNRQWSLGLVVWGTPMESSDACSPRVRPGERGMDGWAGVGVGPPLQRGIGAWQQPKSLIWNEKSRFPSCPGAWAWGRWVDGENNN